MEGDEIKELRPLPEDIQAMTEQETACQYCGISYLLLHKYERMCKYVQQLEQDLSGLRAYENERIDVLKELETLRGLYEKERLKNDEFVNEIERISKERDYYMQQSEVRRNEVDLLKGVQENTQAKLHSLSNEMRAIKKDWMSLRYQIKENIASFDVRSIRSRLMKELEIHSKNSDSEVQSLKNQIGILENDNAHLNSLYKNVIESFESSQKFHAESLQRVQKEHDHTRTTLLETRAELEKMNRQQNNLIQMKMSVDVRIEDMKRQISEKEFDLQNVKSRLENEKKVWEKKEEGYLNEIRALKQRVDVTSISKVEDQDQIAALCQSMSQLNTQLQDMQEERRKTIEAHQSRIKQLQDKFKQDLENIRNIEIQSITQNLKDKYEIEKNSYVNKTQDLEYQFKIQKEETLAEKRQKEKIEAELQYLRKVMDDRERQYKDELKQAVLVKEREIAAMHQQNTDRALESNLAALEEEKLKIRNEYKTKFEELQNHVMRQNTEIAFLKNTVRIECEERMGLMSQIEILKKSETKKSEKVSDDRGQGEPDLASRVYEQAYLKGTPNRQRIRK